MNRDIDNEFNEEELLKRIVLSVVGDFGTVFYEVIDMLWKIGNENLMNKILEEVNNQDCTYFIKGIQSLMRELTLITNIEDIKIRLVTMHINCALVKPKFFDLPNYKVDLFRKFAKTHILIIYQLSRHFDYNTYSKLFESYYLEYDCHIEKNIKCAYLDRMRDIYDCSSSGSPYALSLPKFIDKRIGRNLMHGDEWEYANEVVSSLNPQVNEFIMNWRKYKLEILSK